MKSARIVLGLLLAVTTTAPLRAQVSAFTYQGRLNLNGTPANGHYDFMFRLLNDPTNGAAAPVIPINLAVPVTNGLFTTGIDFGAENFDGANRWLEINVRTNGGGPFTTLSPRQLLTPTPYAIHAGSVSAAGISGTITSNMLAPGAAAANLAASGQAGLPSGGIIISTNANDTNLANSGYVKLGKVGFLEWETVPGGSGVAPSARAKHTAIWTGREMIVWGGDSLASGGRYDPVTQTWKTMTTNDAPSARIDHTAVWTGSEMIIWGGSGPGGASGFNDGGRYNPATDTWTPISNELSNTPTARFFHTAVWTGYEMIVWGGGNGNELNNGGRYDPVLNTWTAIPSNLSNSPAARHWHSAVWTGNEMIIWGGNGTAAFNDGGRFSVAANTWTPISSDLTNTPPPRSLHTAIWSGSEMVIWGGTGNSEIGGRYNPAQNNWTRLSMLSAPATRFHHSAVWTGNEMIVWGGDLNTYGSAFNDGGCYNPVSDTWKLITTTAAPIARTQHTAVWTGNEMVVFGGGNLINYFNDTSSFTPGRLTYLYVRP